MPDFMFHVSPGLISALFVARRKLNRPLSTAIRLGELLIINLFFLIVIIIGIRAALQPLHSSATVRRQITVIAPLAVETKKNPNA